jgi:hypothetical protein
MQTKSELEVAKIALEKAILESEAERISIEKDIEKWNNSIRRKSFRLGATPSQK